ncbi:hypothetical protein CLAFUR0_03751 [Fulvia fulva]|nr:hypothetical protein CLAFUR0_03751 [Fulvia fulva]
MFNFSVMCITYLRFHTAMKAQGIDRKTRLPTVSRWQPYASYWAFLWSFIFLWVQGYAVVPNGSWKASTFIFNYGIIALAGGIGICWKIFKRTRFWRATEVDLVSGLEFFETLTEHYQHIQDGTPVTSKDKIMSALVCVKSTGRC